MVNEMNNAVKPQVGSARGVIHFTLDVHVNRASMGGTITDMEYIEGKFMNTDFEKVIT